MPNSLIAFNRFRAYPLLIVPRKVFAHRLKEASHFSYVKFMWMIVIFLRLHIVSRPFIAVIRNICKCCSGILSIMYKFIYICLAFIYRFDIHQECFFTPSVRSRIVQFILDRQRFPAKSKGEMAFGIERLVAEDVYCSAYPLHDVRS